MRIPNQIAPLLKQLIDVLADILNMEIFENLENSTNIDVCLVQNLINILFQQLNKNESENAEGETIQQYQTIVAHSQQDENVVNGSSNSY